MSLNKVQLIGNVGKDPDVRYLDSGIAVATFPLATTRWLQRKEDIRWQTARRCPNVQNGIISCCGAGWLKLLKNIYIKETSSILKGKSVRVRMMTKTASNAMW